MDIEELQHKLNPQTEFHHFVVEQTTRRRDFSEESMSRRYDNWRKIDESFQSYMPEKDLDARRRGLREAGSPQYTTLYIPYDYATLMSAHTYLTSVFLGRSPAFQYEGRNGESEGAKLAVESLVEYQHTVGRQLPPMYIWIMDASKYGAGFVGTYWCEEIHNITKEVEVQDEFLGVPTGSIRRELQRFPLRAYAGTKLYNIAPYDFYPDPRQTLGNFQMGEFCGRRCFLNWNEIIRKAQYGHYFNLDALRDRRGATGRFVSHEQSSGVHYPFKDGFRTQYSDLAGYEGLEMVVDLIPKDWEVGDSEYPEKWVITLSDEDLVIGFRPLDDSIQQFPYDILEYEVEGYGTFKRGVMDLAKPLTDVMTWLVNTHFYNTRKALNDLFVVDPMKIVVKDVEDPSPGKVIRLKEEAYGQDVRSAIWQFPVNNITQQHLSDMGIVANLAQRITGVNDSVMGMMASGGRKTATEVRTSSSFGVNRLKTVAEWMSACGFSSLAQRELQLTQEYYDEAMKVRIAGQAAWMNPGAERFLQVNPQDIMGFYDFIPVDGTLPVDRFAQVNLWSMIMGQMAAMPQVMLQYDLGKVFAWIAQLGGLKNLDKFKINIVTPEQAAMLAAKGNIVPAGGQGGRSAGNRRGSGNPSSQGGSRVPRQISGMGTSG